MFPSPDSCTFIFILQLSHIEEGVKSTEEWKGRQEKRCTRLQMRGGIRGDKARREGEWEAWHVISKVNPRYCSLLIRGSVSR